MQINDPRQIPQADLPLFVFSNDSTDLISFLITWRTKANWNHAMLCVYSGRFIWQAMSIFDSYRDKPMDQYLKKGMRLDFYTLANMNNLALAACQEYVGKRLKQPWFTKVYDFIGIFGQAIGIPKIHTPGLEYCSEDVTNCLKKISPFLPEADQKIINSIFGEVSPQQLHDIMVANPSVFKPYGLYEADEGVTV